MSNRFQEALSHFNWHRNLVNALWANRVSSKKLIGISPFELFYGTDTLFPTSLAVLIIRLLQESTVKKMIFGVGSIK